MRLKLIEKREELLGIFSFIFEPPASTIWKAGQYLEYRLPHSDMDNRKDKRYFSISNAPFEKNIRLTTRFTSDESSSFKRALFKLGIGDTIEASEPGGVFTLDEPNKEYVFIAGGIGITACRPILLDLDYKKLPINVTLIYANRSPETVVFKKDLEELLPRNPNFKIHYVYDPERVDEAVINKYVPDSDEPIFYVSGPEPMVEAIFKLLESMGTPQEKIKRDYYPGYTGI